MAAQDARSNDLFGRWLAHHEQQSSGRADEAEGPEEVADEACLSPSRFRHLFVEETGMALRPYILWRRFISVWELLMAGESISAAAHAAGFADAAHLTRTSRSMFGIPPSALQMLGPLRADPSTAAAASQPLRSIAARQAGLS